MKDTPTTTEQLIAALRSLSEKDLKGCIYDTGRENGIVWVTATLEGGELVDKLTVGLTDKK